MHKQKILVASDHAGFHMKCALVQHLNAIGVEFEDMGAHQLAPEDDYPTILVPVASRIAQDPEHLRGIVLGGSGNGEAMICKRFIGIRAAVYYGGRMEIVKLSREHNDANVLSLGARFISEEEMKEVVDLWLSTPFSGNERHLRRIELLDRFELGHEPSTRLN